MKRLVLAWAVTAVAATAAAVAVLGLLGGGLTGTSSRVLSQAEIRAALATATTRPPAARPTGTPTAPATPGDGGLVRTEGGTVIAACDGDQVTLRSWTPAQGYSVDAVEPGPGREARVEFDPDEGDDVKLRIHCSAGRPVTLRH
ncbi:hypothetical protein ABT294_12670 [Nonomuraea sp. NPDC000554]|uniref:hypothetical protein n=1 Tax=Nonomuraea sp. NPDC000554 TaxID=3154259 RepID=UPI00332B156D